VTYGEGRKTYGKLFVVGKRTANRPANSDRQIAGLAHGKYLGRRQTLCRKLFC
jgi:hypothetical protein